MSKLASLIEYPWITEKTSILQQGGKYAFRVRRETTKRQIKEFVEETFNVHVIKVNSMIIAGKAKSSSSTGPYKRLEKSTCYVEVR